ncbi:MAG: hypothetical protein ACRC0F_05765, partial [Cetobacterium sp.]
NSANIKNTQLEIELIELTNDRYDDAVDYAYEVNDFIDLVEELEEDSKVLRALKNGGRNARREWVKTGKMLLAEI